MATERISIGGGGFTIEYESMVRQDIVRALDAKRVELNAAQEKFAVNRIRKDRGLYGKYHASIFIVRNNNATLSSEV